MVGLPGNHPECVGIGGWEDAGPTLLSDLLWRTAGGPAGWWGADLQRRRDVIILPVRSLESLVGLEQNAGVGQSPGFRKSLRMEPEMRIA